MMTELELCVCVVVEGGLLRVVAKKGQGESSGVMETLCVTIWVVVAFVHTFAKMQTGPLKIIPLFSVFWVPIAV